MTSIKYKYFALLVFTATIILSGCEEFGEDDIELIYIDDETLDDVEYHEISYDIPTTIVFSNLTTVTNSVYFHKCTNIKSVQFPNLVSVGGTTSGNPYFYFHENQGLEIIDAPNLNQVYGYVYLFGNASLDVSNSFCGLSDVFSRGTQDDCSDGYIAIDGNANDQTCFSATIHLCD